MIKAISIIAAIGIGGIISEHLAHTLHYTINWTAVGICATAMIAIWQLRENSDQKAKDRELETKRDILFDGVRGMSEVMRSFSHLSNLDVEFSELMKMFQSGMAKMSVATSVANLHTAKCGKEFADKLGPMFIWATSMRLELDHIENDETSDYWNKRKALQEYVLNSSIELGKIMNRAIAAVRTDVGIAKESEQQFLDVVQPNEALLKSAVDEAVKRISAQ